MAHERPRRPRKWLHPDGARRDYERAMRSLAQEIRRAVMEHVFPVLSDLREDRIEDIPEADGWYEVLRRAFLGASGGIAVQEAVSQALAAGDLAARFNKRQIHKILRSAYGVDITKREPWLASYMSRWEAENVRLIRSIPSQALDRMHGKVVAAVRRGATAKTLRDELTQEFGITRRRARLIARDQIEKLNADLTRRRQTDIGVTEYIWRGMMDERERPEHVAREGKTFSWDSPPEDGHAGEAINCRCYGEPVLPLLADLDIDSAIEPQPMVGMMQ